MNEWKLWNGQLCFEGRCSIQLSYGRTVYFRNLNTELAAWDSDSLILRLPRCAQFCAHPNATWPRTRLLRKHEDRARRFQFGCIRRSAPAFTRRSGIRPSELETYYARKRARTGECVAAGKNHLFICRKLGRFQPVTLRHPTALWHFLNRYNCRLITREFELEGPSTQDSLAACLRRLEFPKLRRF